MMRLPVSYHISIQHAEKIKLLERGAEAVWEVSDVFLLEVFPQILLTIILVIIGCTISIPLTCIALSFLPIAVYVNYYFGRTAHDNQRQADTYWDKAFGRI
jgi:ABC-type multidrug transport system fused ATPase/permease subunit